MITTTSYTRTIDDFGRISIPKELRRQLCIREGNELKISIWEDKLVIEKFSPIEILKNQLQDLVNAAANAYGRNFVITDQSKVIVTSEKTQSLLDARISQSLVDTMVCFHDFLADSSNEYIYIDESGTTKTDTALIIRNSGRIYGVVAAIGVSNNDYDYYATKMIRQFVENQLNV